MLLLQCHYLKVLGVDRDYSSYCALMSTRHAAGRNKIVSLVHFLIRENQCHYVRWQNDVCALLMQLSCPEIPFAVACLLRKSRDDGEKRLHLPKWRQGRHQHHCAAKLDENKRTLISSDSFDSISISLCPLAFFICSFSVAAAECPDSPFLPHLFTPPSLTSHF